MKPHVPAGLKKLGTIRRKAVSVSQEELTRLDYIRPGQALPLVVEPAVDGVNLTDWASNNREFIESRLQKHGGILFRNFHVTAAAGFESFVQVASGELLEYRERSTPRSRINGNVYTSTDYPADQSIFPHNENSYQHTFPQHLVFCCAVQPGQGGETPIVDCRKVLTRIDPEIRERFIQKKVLYVRNFGDGFGLPWQDVFQTDDEHEVDAYCRKVGITTEWKAGNGLRTRSVLPAVVHHPQTRELVWFNHATFFHVSTLAPLIRDALLADFREEDLPNQTYYGDGTPIEPEVLERLRNIYLQEKVVFPWQKGDVLMLDNILTGHAREPFSGPRKILTAMTRPCTRE